MTDLKEQQAKYPSHKEANSGSKRNSIVFKKVSIYMLPEQSNKPMILISSVPSKLVLSIADPPKKKKKTRRRLIFCSQDSTNKRRKMTKKKIFPNKFIVFFHLT